MLRYQKENRIFSLKMRLNAFMLYILLYAEIPMPLHILRFKL